MRTKTERATSPTTFDPPTVLRALVAGALLAAGCSSGPVGGPVAGPADTHCKGKKPQPTASSACYSKGTGGGSSTGGGSAGGGGGAASGAGGGMPSSDYGPTNFGTEADDDDCKYHLSWTATPIVENTAVTFTAVVTKLTDGSPASGATLVSIEGFLNDTHPILPTRQVFTESPPGTYAISPIEFDEKGRWTARFHVFEECYDLSPESPHGHAAFYVEVP